MRTIATKKRNNAIDLFRYVCAVLVVIIHTEPFYIGDCSWLGIFLKEFLARIAVPFFFVVSGYFLFSKIDDDAKAPFRSMWRLAKVYAFWSIPYVLINLWIRRGETGNLTALIAKTLFEFFVSGSYSHFWFFPGLIYAIFLTAIIYKCVGWKPVAAIAVVLYVLGLLGSSYLPLGTQIPVLSALYAWEYFSIIYRIFMTAVPFVALGGWIARRQKNTLVSYRHQSYDWCILAGIVAAFVLEKCVLVWVKYPIIHPNTVMLYPLTAVVFVMLLRHPMEKHTTLAAQAKTTANFVYYMHMACILFVERGTAAVLHGTLDGLWVFLITVTLLTVGGVILHRVKWMRKLLN